MSTVHGHVNNANGVWSEATLGLTRFFVNDLSVLESSIKPALISWNWAMMKDLSLGVGTFSVSEGVFPEVKSRPTVLLSPSFSLVNGWTTISYGRTRSLFQNGKEEGLS